MCRETLFFFSLPEYFGRHKEPIKLEVIVKVIDSASRGRGWGINTPTSLGQEVIGPDWRLAYLWGGHICCYYDTKTLWEHRGRNTRARITLWQGEHQSKDNSRARRTPGQEKTPGQGEHHGKANTMAPEGDQPCAFHGKPLLPTARLHAPSAHGKTSPHGKATRSKCTLWPDDYLRRAGRRDRISPVRTMTRGQALHILYTTRKDFFRVHHANTTSSVHSTEKRLGLCTPRQDNLLSAP